ncbi:ester cyclase [Nakamurella sp. GG22]
MNCQISWHLRTTPTGIKFEQACAGPHPAIRIGAGQRADQLAEDAIYRGRKVPLTLADDTLGTLEGPAALKNIMDQSQRAFPDTVWTIDEQVASQDAVATRFTWNATHRGDFNGLLATGKRFSVAVVSFDSFRDGRMAQTRMFRDNLHLLGQLGFIPEREALAQEIAQHTRRATLATGQGAD